MTPTDALWRVLETDEREVAAHHEAIGLDCCDECAEDWPCPTAIVSDALEQGAHLFTVDSLARELDLRLGWFMDGGTLGDWYQEAAAIIAAAKEAERDDADPGVYFTEDSLAAALRQVGIENIVGPDTASRIIAAAKEAERECAHIRVVTVEGADGYPKEVCDECGD
jgi:hypothetical protein